MMSIALLLFFFRLNSKYEIARKILGLQETCWYVATVVIIMNTI